MPGETGIRRKPAAALRTMTTNSDPLMERFAKLTHTIIRYVARSLPPSWPFSRQAENKRAVAPLFDGRWYLKQNPDVAASQRDPLTHFLTKGTAQGRNPNPLFDCRWYVHQNPDVEKTGMNPLVHFVAYGCAEGRDPHPLFDTRWYSGRYPDVAESGINALLHFLAHGGAEGRDPCPLFDSRRYLDMNPDVADAGLNPLVHFLDHGSTEGRSPFPYFDPQWYVETYPEVAQSGQNPLVHYRMRGAQKGYDPGPEFDTSFYVSRYPDVSAAQTNPLEHFVRRGRQEGRLPSLRPSMAFLKHGPSMAAQVTARRMLAAYAASEPAFRSIEAEALFALPLTNVALSRSQTAWRRLYLSLSRAPDTVLLVGSLGQSTHGLVVASLLAAMQAVGRLDDFLVIETDSHRPGLPSELPKGTAWRSFAEFEAGLEQADRAELVRAYIHNLAPRTLMVAGSRAGWAAVNAHGRALAGRTRLCASILDEETNLVDDPPAYELRACLPILSSLLVESRLSRARIIGECGVPSTMQGKIDVAPDAASPEHWLSALHSGGQNVSLAIRS